MKEEKEESAAAAAAAAAAACGIGVYLRFCPVASQRNTAMTVKIRKRRRDLCAGV